MMAGHDRSVRKIAALMNPWVRESPIVTRRFFGRPLRSTVTGTPSVGSDIGRRGSLRIDTLDGVVEESVIAASLLPPAGCGVVTVPRSDAR